MIVARTPFRITLGGGGTDLPSYYEKHGGFILAMGIDKYMHIAINTPLVDRKIRLQYTKSETDTHPDELQHELAREALKRHGWTDEQTRAVIMDTTLYNAELNTFLNLRVAFEFRPHGFVASYVSKRAMRIGYVWFSVESPL